MGVPEEVSVILLRFPFSILHFRGFWQVFLFVSVFPRVLTGFPIGKWYFYEASTCRHGYANVTWDLWWGARGVFCDFDTFSSFNFARFSFLQAIFLGFWQVFLLTSDISMRHRHADMDMQMWLGTCRWECQRGFLWFWYVFLFQYCTF